jgi:hypothetical protein
VRAGGNTSLPEQRFLTNNKREEKKNVRYIKNAL